MNPRVEKKRNEKKKKKRVLVWAETARWWIHEWFLKALFSIYTQKRKEPVHE